MDTNEASFLLSYLPPDQLRCAKVSRYASVRLLNPFGLAFGSHPPYRNFNLYPIKMSYHFFIHF